MASLCCTDCDDDDDEDEDEGESDDDDDDVKFDDKCPSIIGETH